MLIFVVGWRTFYRLRSRSPGRGPDTDRILEAGAALSFVLIGNALKCLKLHEPVLSYVTAGMTVAGTAVAAAEVLSAGRSQHALSRTVKGIAAAFLAGGAGWGGVFVLLLVPWSLHGDLPVRWRTAPFAPALRPMFYAALEGHVHPEGPAQRDLSGIRLEGADLRGAVFRAAGLRDAVLKRARMESADLRGAVFRNADLTEAILIHARLEHADLSGAVLVGADMDKAVLCGAILDGADLTGVRRLRR